MGYSHCTPTHVAQKLHKKTSFLRVTFLTRLVSALLMCLMIVLAMVIRIRRPFPSILEVTQLLRRRGPVLCTCTQWVTSINMSGELMSPPFLVFKGNSNGRIEKKELVSFFKEADYCLCRQRPGSARGSCSMLLFVCTFFKDWVVTRRAHHPGVIPLFVLDTFSVHILRSVINAIEDMGCDVCTYLFHPGYC
jgi:hypothetical protein